LRGVKTGERLADRRCKTVSASSPLRAGAANT